MNLTKASQYIKLGLKIASVVIVFYYIFIFFLFPRVRNTIRKILPDRDPANALYGTLPALSFEQKKIEGEPKYELNTKGGYLDFEFPRKLPVYKFIPPQFSYLAGKNAQNHAFYLGFSDRELISDLKGNVYKWREIVTGGTLTIQINTLELLYQTDLENVTSKIYQANVNKETAIREAEKIFINIQRYNTGLYANGKKTAVLGTAIGNKIVELKSNVDGNAAKVSLFKKIGDYDVLTSNYDEGNLSLIYSPSSLRGTPYKHPYIKAIYWDVDTNPEATYPIIFVDEAWNKVKDGNGVIASVLPKDGNIFEPYKPVRVEKIIINNVYLAYYEATVQQTYMQPIFVFEGNYTTRGTDGGSVVIYYPAVSGDFIKQPEK